MHQVIDFVRSQPKGEELLVSYVPGEGGPKGFYDKLGFTETGLMDGDERVMRLALEP
jgi:diamine N-acetyltransferase